MVKLVAAFLPRKPKRRVGRRAYLFFSTARCWPPENCPAFEPFAANSPFCCCPVPYLVTMGPLTDPDDIFQPKIGTFLFGAFLLAENNSIAIRSGSMKQANGCTDISMIGVGFCDRCFFHGNQML